MYIYGNILIKLYDTAGTKKTSMESIQAASDV